MDLKKNPISNSGLFKSPVWPDSQDAVREDISILLVYVLAGGDVKSFVDKSIIGVNW